MPRMDRNNFLIRCLTLRIRRCYYLYQDLEEVRFTVSYILHFLSMKKWPYYALVGVVTVLIVLEIPRLLVALGIISVGEAQAFYTLSFMFGWPLYAAVLVTVVVIPIFIVIGPESELRNHLATWYIVMIGSVLAGEIPIIAIAMVVSTIGFVALTVLPFYWLRQIRRNLLASVDLMPSRWLY
jgi:hypothetical protein